MFETCFYSNAMKDKEWIELRNRPEIEGNSILFCLDLRGVYLGFPNNSNLDDKYEEKLA